MMWFYEVLDKTSKPVPLTITAVLVAIVFALEGKVLKNLKQATGQGVLDHKLYYSLATVTKLFQSYGPNGLKLYERFLTLDIAFPFLYGTLFADVFYLGSKEANWEWIAFLPPSASTLDYLENVFFYNFVRMYPKIPHQLVSISYWVSVLKFAFGFASLVAGFLCVLLFIARFLKP